jgi:zinc protease
MQHRFPLRIPVLAAALLAAALSRPAGTAAAPAAPAKPGVSVPPPAQRKHTPIAVSTLGNGLRLFVRPDPASEILSIVCLVRAGLPDEPESKAGIAALTAEALLQGTTTHPGATFRAEIARAGGNIRTLPSFDFTEITVVTNGQQVEPALRLVADLVTHPSFTAEGIAAAREAVKRRAEVLQQDFTGASYQSLLAQLYPNTPYGRPVTGYAETLDKLTAADVRAFWQSHYVQNRMFLAVVGDADAAKVTNAAQRAFQNVPFAPGAPVPNPANEILSRPRVEWMERPGPAAQVMIGFLTPRTDRAAYPVYALLDAVVGGGKRARLFANIREKHRLGYEMGSFYQPLAFQSHLVGYVIAPPFRRDPQTERTQGLVELVKQELLAQYRTLADTGPTDAELARAKAYVVGRYALRQERTRDQAKWIAWNAAMGLGHDFDDAFPVQVQTVTKEQLQAAAKRSLMGYGLVVTVPKPEGREEGR